MSEMPRKSASRTSEESCCWPSERHLGVRVRNAKEATALCGRTCPVDSNSLCRAEAGAEASVRMPVGIRALSSAFT